MLPLVDLVPEGALQVLDVCLANYGIHSMYGMAGGGARFTNKYRRWQDGTAPSNWERHDGFSINWGLRPIGVERAGFISLAADWIMRGRAKNYSFKGFGFMFNFPGHTVQYGPRRWDDGTKDEKFARLIEFLEGGITKAFVNFGTDGQCFGSCSHRDPTLKDGEVLTEPGFVTSGRLLQRVW